ncbi:MAG: DUF3298 and DUF4163 domain-containing protein [Peptococcaceae bacterium]|nr:DUF3298 and DUF4163 domain-containing protein [Peptococcaceae bacterium]
MFHKDLSTKISEVQIENECTDVVFPQVSGLGNDAVEDKINRLIEERVLAMIPREGCDVYGDINGDYEVMLNERGILSLKFNVFTIRIHAANGIEEQRSLTVNLETGRLYRLYDLFKRNSNYKSVINEIIREQIEERDIPLIKEFAGIDDYEDYYLTKNNLVIYFQELEFTPHFVGIPEFPIPYSQIKNLIRKDGPIARFI